MNKIEAKESSSFNIFKTVLSAVGGVACLAASVAMLNFALHSMHFAGGDWLYIFKLKKNILWLYAGSGLAAGLGIFLLASKIQDVLFKKQKGNATKCKVAFIVVALIAAVVAASLSAKYLDSLQFHWTSLTYTSYVIKNCPLTQLAFAGLTLGTLSSAITACSLLKTLFQKKNPPVKEYDRFNKL